MLGRILRLVLIAFFMFLFFNLIGIFAVAFSVNKRVTIGTGSENVACVGVFDEQDPHYTYKLNTYNTVISIVFIETIFIPIYVGNNYILCPSGVVKK